MNKSELYTDPLSFLHYVPHKNRVNELMHQPFVTTDSPPYTGYGGDGRTKMQSNNIFIVPTVQRKCELL